MSSDPSEKREEIENEPKIIGHFLRGDDDDDQTPAFLVSGPLCAPSDEPPIDGFDYLKRVKWEAKNCPDIVIATGSPSLPSSRQRKRETTSSSSRKRRKTNRSSLRFPQGERHEQQKRNLKLPKGWMENFLFEFEELRNRFSSFLEQDQNKEQKKEGFSREFLKRDNLWKSMGHHELSSSSSTTSSSSSTTSSFKGGREQKEKVSLTEQTTNPSLSPDLLHPNLKIILQFDQVLVQSLLQQLIEWSSFPFGLSSFRLQWIFCLLVVLEKPIGGDMSFLLRNLVRNCFNVRKELDERVLGNGEQDLVELESQIEASTTVIIILIAKYFNQFDPSEFIFEEVENEISNQS